MFTRVFWMKAGERAVRAYLIAFLTVLVGAQTEYNAGVLEAAAVAAIGPALSVLLSLLGSQVGDAESPSLLPAVTGKPTPEPDAANFPAPLDAPDA